MMSVTLIILRLDLNLGSSLRQERNIALLTERVPFDLAR